MLERPQSLLCLDVQQEFFDRSAQTFEAINVCHRLIQTARANGWPIAHSFLRQRDGPLHFASSLRPVSGFEPRADEAVFVRAELSAYANQHFAAHMEAQIAPVLLVGFSASVTLLATVFDALSRGHAFIVAENGCLATSSRAANSAEHLRVSLDVASLLGFPIVRLANMERSDLFQSRSLPAEGVHV